MASLTETAYLARKGVNIAIILTIAFIIIRILLSIALGIYRSVFPPKPPPANCLFGPLPYPNAQNNIATPSGLTVDQEISDSFDLPPALKVYFLPEQTSSFTSFDKMKSLASRMGFSSTPTKQEANIWKFIDPGNSLRTLEVNEITGDFHLQYNYASDLSLFNEKNFGSLENVTSKAKDFYQTIGLLKENDDETTTITTTYLKLENNVLTVTTSLANADAVAVTFNRPEIDKVPIVSPDQKFGLVSIILSGNSNDKKRVLEAKYFSRPIQKESLSTYPTIPLEEALGNLKSGKWFIANLPKNPPNKFVVRTVSLGYLDPFPSQSYLQPVYIFSDEKGFVSYTPAIYQDCSKK